MQYNKRILTKAEVLNPILEATRIISAVVKVTLGPGGLPILLERQGESPTGDKLEPMVTKDGVTVANACFSRNPKIDVVMQAIKAVCRKTNSEVGDGTTTAITLAEAILNAAFEKMANNPELNPQLLREEIESGLQTVLELLKQESEEVKDLDKIADVATLSANGDRHIGELIKQAFEAVGAEGVITLDEGHSSKSTIEIVDGFQIRRGAEGHSSFFNSSDKTKFEADNCRVLLYDGSIKSFMEFVPVMQCLEQEAIATNKKNFPPLLVVANDFSPSLMQFLLINKVDSGLTLCAVKSPHATQVRTAILDDMAILLNGTRLGNGAKSLDAVEPSDIGLCSKVVVDKYSTTFYGGEGKEENILTRIEQLKQLRKEAESPYDAAVVSDRIAALSGGIAKIGVGGVTELEVKERYHRIEDALNAARAAVEEGIVAGGGVTLLRISEKLKSKENLTVGEEVLCEALRIPFYQILANIGITKEKLSENAFILPRILTEKDLVFDARNKKLVNAKETGIIDPTKVVRVALENAVSVAGLLSTCGGAVIFNR